MEIFPSHESRDFQVCFFYTYIVFICQTIFKLWVGWFSFAMFVICAVFFTLAIFHQKKWCFLLLSISTVPCLIVELWVVMEHVQGLSGAKFFFYVLFSFINFCFVLYILYISYSRYIWLSQGGGNFNEENAGAQERGMFRNN